MSAPAPTSRLSNWEDGLSNFMVQNRNRPFEWGQWDCILFACAAAEAVTGEDKAADFRGQYTDETGARAALRKLGKGTLLRTVDSRFKRIPVTKAQRGDLIWHDGCVGVCLGGAAAFLTDPDIMDALSAPRNGQLIILPRSLWQKAWRV
jgi:hypothetical protein